MSTPNQRSSGRSRDGREPWVREAIRFRLANEDPVAYIEERHDRITNLHLKDRKRNDGPNTRWGQGDTPITQVLELLKAKKYPIPAHIEYEYDGPDGDVAEVRKCFDYVKAALA
jgi:sugar phosphate isomerase/epimerase